MKIKFLIPTLLLLASCGTQVAKNNTTDTVSGFYIIQNDDSNSACQMELTLKQDAAGFDYHLITDKKDVKGKAIMHRDMDSKEDYIILYNIPWDDYQGDISQENEEDIQEKKLELPTEVSGTINGDTITIQNYGNAMNYYVKFSEFKVNTSSLLKILT